MKKAFLTLMATVVACVLCSCVDTFSGTIEITPSLSYVPYTGGTVDISIKTDLPWKVVTEDDCPATFSKVNGVGDDVVTVTIPATDNWTTTCVPVQFYCRYNSSSNYKYAYITQGYKPYISVSGSSGTVDAAGGVVTVVVTANEKWTASCDTPGVSVRPTSEEVGNYTVNIHVPANTTGR